MSVHSFAPRLAGVESRVSRVSDKVLLMPVPSTHDSNPNRLILTDAEGTESSGLVQDSSFLPMKEFVRYHLAPQSSGWCAPRPCWFRNTRDLLIAVYDGIEVLHASVNQRDDMRHAVGMDNLLLNTLVANGFVGDSPSFSNGISEISSESEDNYHALIVDSDNSAFLSRPTHEHTLKYANEELAYGTGTPRYIARAVSKGQLIEDVKLVKIFSTMPELKGKAKELYIATYGQEIYDRYTDVAANTFHGSKFDEFSEITIALPFSHRPDHDVESMFWVLIFTLILALPLGATDEPTQEFVKAYDILDSHAIVRDETLDSRSYFFEIELNAWKRMLHPKLMPVAAMMMKLANQVSPEYGFLDPPPKRDHLHEAFRRILLEQILAMENDPIPLTPNVSREPPPTRSAGQVAAPRLKSTVSKAAGRESTSKKRKAEDNEKTERKPKSVKTTSVHSSRYIND